MTSHFTNPLGRRAVTAGLLMTMLPAARSPGTIRIAMTTTAGEIEISLFADKAPATVANFLRYVDAGLYGGGTFYRTVNPANDRNPKPITVIQGGLLRDPPAFPPIAIETTKETGLRHRDGMLSMARMVPGWSTPDASSEFFICVGDNPVLDAGGGRTADGLGFAAFGQVTKGMEIVRTIHGMKTSTAQEPAYWAGQLLDKPVAIRGIARQKGAGL